MCVCVCVLMLTDCRLICAVPEGHESQDVGAGPMYAARRIIYTELDASAPSMQPK